MRILVVLFGLTLLSCTEKLTGLEEAESVQAVNNRDYFNCAVGGIESAQEEIDVVLYLAKYTPGSEDSVYILLRKLIEADRGGAEVRVLLENSLEENVPTADYLLGEGVDVRFDPPNVTTHAKFILIDSKFLLLGSSNWTNHAIKYNNETNLLVTDSELAKKYDKYFDELWANSQKSVESAPLFQEP